MNREIKFRGLSAVNGKWYYGYLVIYQGCYYIYEENGDHHTVIPRTVGQFTGLSDKNGKEIYEGDVAEYKECSMVKKYTVVWMGSGFCLGSCSPLYYLVSKVEVLGNIHDTPELVSD